MKIKVKKTLFSLDALDFRDESIEGVKRVLANELANQLLFYFPDQFTFEHHEKDNFYECAFEVNLHKTKLIELSKRALESLNSSLELGQISFNPDAPQENSIFVHKAISYLEEALEGEVGMMVTYNMV